MFKFLHCADLHIDSPLRGLGRYDGAPVEQLRLATRRAFENLGELAIAEEVAFVLLAGDLYDGDWRDYNTGLFFGQQMAKLKDAGIAAYCVYGNHDAQSNMTRKLQLPDNVHAFAAKRPESIPIEDLGVMIHGQSFARPAIEADLSAAYPDAVPAMFNIGLLHTCAEDHGHARYAPTTVENLANKGYDYWALGHVHRRQVLREEPWIVFPGNIQGRHIRETGAKGCTLVTVENHRVTAVEPRALDVLRWERCTVSADGAGTAADVWDRVFHAVEETVAASEGRLTAMRLDITGRCRAHAELSRDHERWMSEIRQVATTASSGQAWIEKIRLETSTGATVDELLDSDDALSGLLRGIQELCAEDERLVEMKEIFKDLHAKMPPELRSGEDALELYNPDILRAAIDDAKKILLDRLLRGNA